MKRKYRIKKKCHVHIKKNDPLGLKFRLESRKEEVRKKLREKLLLKWICRMEKYTALYIPKEKWFTESEIILEKRMDEEMKGKQWWKRGKTILKKLLLKRVCRIKNTLHNIYIPKQNWLTDEKARGKEKRNSEMGRKQWKRNTIN